MKANLRACIKASEEEPVAIAGNGKPVAVLLPIDDDAELERLALAYSRYFQRDLREAREQVAATGGIPHDDFTSCDILCGVTVLYASDLDLLDRTQRRKDLLRIGALPCAPPPFTFPISTRNIQCVTFNAQPLFPPSHLQPVPFDQRPITLLVSHSYNPW